VDINAGQNPPIPLPAAKPQEKPQTKGVNQREQGSFFIAAQAPKSAANFSSLHQTLGIDLRLAPA